MSDFLDSDELKVERLEAEIERLLKARSERDIEIERLRAALEHIAGLTAVDYRVVSAIAREALREK